MSIAPYPLLFAPILKEKVWGGRTLERLGKALPPARPIGESWEIADLDSTSTDGGGGDAAQSIIANGPLAGTPLRDAVGLWGRAITGGAQPRTTFPLLVKYLDARENLSVQVHPSPDYARTHPDAHLKTESWYIVHAEPGALIYKGVKAGVTPEQFARHIADATVVNDIIAVPARAGDCHHLPSGTCHALGAGILVAEIQTASDTTFRVFDWGRTGRTLHVQQALECIDFAGALARPVARADALGAERRGPRAALGETEFYELAEIALAGAPDTREYRWPAHQPTILMCLRGSATLAGNGFAPVALPAGVTTLIPAGLGEVRLSLSPGAASALLLEARVK